MIKNILTLGLIYLGINALFAILVCLCYLFIHICDFFYDIKQAFIEKRKRNSYKRNKKITSKILSEFENLLNSKNIKIPNIDREGNEDEACIYGRDYYNLEETIIEILKER